ncbi:hypothetical protein GT370_02565 [Acidocella sp. MX-AZ03]|uniref:hypothetical protein n=1 Tax=Acidocella sp. MX-AZ03 TaxID=2697363 RepID=UPI0022DE08A6|nr:hypothetical protein [Acidocella sp. MX-AZ03]WBO59800.1 hypothetical protein GT370_02565 [Acidocella sp. MX-AZ03]
MQANPAAATALVTQGVTTTITQLTQDTTALINLGARMLIVPNLPDLGLTPNFNTTAQGVALGMRSRRRMMRRCRPRCSCCIRAPGRISSC